MSVSGRLVSIAVRSEHVDAVGSIQGLQASIQYYDLVLSELWVDQIAVGQIAIGEVSTDAPHWTGRMIQTC